MIPLAVPIATLRTCIARQCCVARFKQPIGELIMVTAIAVVYIGTVVGVVLPKIDEMLELGGAVRRFLFFSSNILSSLVLLHCLVCVRS